MKTSVLILAAALALPSAALAQSRGDWVLAPWGQGNFLFPGVVQSNSGGRVVVRFDDGDVATLQAAQVKPFDWRAGSRVQCRWQNGSEWYRGQITAIASDGLTMEVLYEDGDRERTNTGRCRVAY